ncbi:regulator of chromosome condensation 1/beta-lactamase-inhibitor protein II [Dipodascopsis uninucleata]
MAPSRKRKELHEREEEPVPSRSKRSSDLGIDSKKPKSQSNRKASGKPFAKEFESVATELMPSTITKRDKNEAEDQEATTEVKHEVTETNGTSGVKKSDEKGHYEPYRLKKAPGKLITPIPELKMTPLNIYVFGTGSMSELGLGPDSNNKEVKRPRLNPFLPIDKVSIVDFAVGGAHVLAIDKRGKLWSWGCNDHGALGRNTSKGEEGLLRDMDAEESDDDGSLNPLESTPTLVEGLPDSTIFVQVAASDNLSLALTSEGRLWAWGTFRCNEGVLGFSETTEFQRTPVQVPIPYPVGQICAGKDHVMALTVNGRVYSWGNGQQFQLGRRVVERARMQSLQPREFGIKNIKYISSGEFHAFAIDTSNHIMAWGLNQYGQCGIPSEGAGEDGAVITAPTYVESLDNKDIISISAGEHHTIALSSNGDMYAFGRVDSSELGIEKEKLSEVGVKDESGHLRFIPVPTKVEVEDDNDEEVKFKYIACGSHHNVALSKKDGSAWTWGFGESYQVGQGPAGEDVETPTKIENTATRGVNMILAGAGGQFSVIGGLPVN